MALQESLAKIQEYNAAIELPHAGLLGIKGFLKNRPSGTIAGRIDECLQLCEQAELALSGDQNAARRDIHFYTAMRTLFAHETENRLFRDLLADLRVTLSSLSKHLHLEASASAPSREDLLAMAIKLESLAEKIRHGIPRDAYLASIVGGAYAGPGIAR